MLTGVTAAHVRRWASESVAAVARYREPLNRANVFPVPDSDTGTNLLLTLTQGAASIGRHDDVSLALSEFAGGALVGARGNSGTILAEYLQGLANAAAEFAGAEAGSVLDGVQLAAAFDRGASAAFRAVAEPAPGTILTAARSAADAAVTAVAAAPDLDTRSVTLAALAAARAAVSHGPEELDVLRRAGVVDSGAVGLVLVLSALAGALSPGLSGEDDSSAAHGSPSPDDAARNLAHAPGAGPAVGWPAADEAAKGVDDQVAAADEWLATAVTPFEAHPWRDETAALDPEHPFEFMCLAYPEADAGDGSLDPVAELRSRLADTGVSLVVIGDALESGHAPARVHIHTPDPAAVIAAADGWRLRQVVVHELSRGFGHRHGAGPKVNGDGQWSWIGVTRAPGLLAEIARAGGIALFSQDGTVEVNEFARALTDAGCDSVLVLSGIGEHAPRPQESEASPGEFATNLARAAKATGKTARIVAGDAVANEAQLAAALGHLPMLVTESFTRAESGLDAAWRALLPIPASGASAATAGRAGGDGHDLTATLTKALQPDDLLVVVADDSWPREARAALSDAVRAADCELVLVASGRTGNGYAAAIERL
ncbi:hypothetical protein GCM10010401_18700 [Rarobacter faecitabidus]|uniref:DhaL domain-containing protein n=1 Tax=Rarobacter faecitabidus TaxID=13243 RepID=A0A542ZV69_RARFA|nr:DAK2 domain-containing protein [Rarobacter faecitabidus]TQL64080.1 hypothetical protein FB461_0565 [Rarobacter faecitabidus]